MIKRTVVLVTLVLGVAAVALAGSASASGPPVEGSGTFTETSSVVASFRQAGGVSFLVLDNVVDWTGPITGTAQETLYVTVMPSGAAVFRGTDVFPSGMTITLQGRDNAGAFHGTFATTGPHGSNGHGTFDGLDSCGGGGVCGTYAGSFLS